MATLTTRPAFTRLMTRAYRSLNKSLKRSPSAARHDQAVEFAEEEVLPAPPRTNVCVWTCAICCSILSILVIIAGMVVLIGYMSFHPHLPGFHVEGGRLNTLFLDINFALQSDITIVFSAHNPNSKVSEYYERITFDLLFDKQIISSVMIAPFKQTRKDYTALQFHMPTGTVQLQPAVGLFLSESIQKNKIACVFEGTVRTRAQFGSITSVKYTLHTRCQLEFNSPPPIGNGTMVSHNCTTWR